MKMSDCQQSQCGIHVEPVAPFPAANLSDRIAVSSDEHVVMVTDDDVAMLVGHTVGSVPSSELSQSCKRPSEPFIGTFDEAERLDDTAVGDDYTKDQAHRESLCMMGDVDVAGSYEDQTMLAVDRVSVVCDGQMGEQDYCSVKELSSCEEVLTPNALKHEDSGMLETVEVGVEPNCAGEETCRALEPLLANGASSSIYQMVNNADGTVSLVGVDLEHLLHIQGDVNEADGTGLRLMQIRTVSLDTSAVLPHQVTKPLPPDCPSWAASLNDCERIGNSFRGWVETEAELDCLLTSYKQATSTYWGTRQSPSPSQKSTRLMWKSQYVPFDGVPFINIGSRAVVLECQFGPRRKNHIKKTAKASFDARSSMTGFSHSCPARIYVKKVRKFVDCAVDTTADKKQLKVDMDRAFQSIKDCYLDKLGHDRLYVQLPTAAAHEYHLESVVVDTVNEAADVDSGRLHPNIVQKIREIVSRGERRQYAIRHLLRRYVEKELSFELGHVPEKHNLSYYPTIHDLQNHIHKALQDIKDGTLLSTSNTEVCEVDFTVMSEKLASSCENIGALDAEPSSSWLPPESGASDVATESAQAMKVEAVTLLLSVEPGQNTVTRVEVKTADGKTHVSDTVPPDIAHIVSMVPPEIFATKSIQSQEVVDTCSSAFDETPSASLKDDSDGCVLLCNLSESEVEEASPVDCDEQCRRAADRRAPVEESQLRQVACSTEPKCSLDASPQLHSDSVSPQNFVSSTASARCSDRAKRSSPSHSLSVTSRKKLKRH